MTSTMTNPITSSSKSSRTIKYNAAIYSLIGASSSASSWSYFERQQPIASICHWYNGHSMYWSSHIGRETPSTSSFFQTLGTDYHIQRQAAKPI